jgi:lipopolysaccharide assembly protein A
MTDKPPFDGEVTPATPSPAVTRGSRISAAWIGVIVATVALVLLLVFILQNRKDVKISFFTFNGSMPLGVALLLAAAAGVLIAAVAASLRIWQLRRRVNKKQGP